MADPNWKKEIIMKKFFQKEVNVARMIAHITYLSESALQRKFEEIFKIVNSFFGFDTDFQIESYQTNEFHLLRGLMLTVIYT